MDKKEVSVGNQSQSNGTTSKISYKDYLAQKEKERKKKPLEIPLPVKIILISPFLMIACFGLYYIPFMVFQVATSPSQEEKAIQEISVLKKK